MAQNLVISMEKVKGDQNILQSHGKVPVLIICAGSYYRPESKGYTDEFEKAGIWSLEQAYDLTNHTGPERDVKYRFITPDEAEDLLKKAKEKLAYLESSALQYFQI